MDYKVKRTSAKISVYTMAKELGVDEKTYRKLEKGIINLDGEQLQKFMDVINNAKEINFNRKMKMQEVNEWLTSGKAREDMEKMGYTQPTLAQELGCHNSYVNHTLKDEKSASDDFKEKMYDFLQNPFNKIDTIKKEVSTRGNKPKKVVGKTECFKEEAVMDEKDHAIDCARYYSIVNPSITMPNTDVEMVLPLKKMEEVIGESKDARIAELEKQNKKLEAEVKYLKLAIRRMLQI